MITYKKLKDGSWGVIGPVTEVHKGLVTVQKASGERKTEEVTAVSKSFKDKQGIELCIGFLVAKNVPQRSYPRKRSGGRYECEECGDLVYPGSRCWETGMTH